jgi:DNA-binding response OmpR family regulator
MLRNTLRPVGEVHYAGRILLIETDPLDLETYTDVLQHYGHEVVSHGSYEEAVHLLQNESFDLVIVDQGGPRFEARRVLERLHSLGDRIPSLVIAEHPDVDSYVKALSLGASDYLKKPIPPQTLRQAVDATLSPGMSAVRCD